MAISTSAADIRLPALLPQPLANNSMNEMEREEESQMVSRRSRQSTSFGELTFSDDDDDVELGGTHTTSSVELLTEDQWEASSPSMANEFARNSGDVTVNVPPENNHNDSPPVENSSSSSSRGALPEHLGKHRQYWRDILLGVNDGIISTFLLVAGVAGGGLDSRSILLTAIAGTVAGAVSMCAGEFVATKSQNEVLEGEIKLERLHVMHYRQEEIKELAELLEIIGITKNQVALRQQLLQFYDHNPESLLKAMIALEFGVLEEEVRSPWIAGLTNFALFTWGALPSVVPFAFAKHANHGLIAAAVFTVAALLLVGAIKTWATRGNCLTASMENLGIAVVGGGLAYGIGLLFDFVVK